MVANEDELELACCMKNIWRVERGNGWLGEEEGDFLYRKLISPGWYYQLGLIILATAGFDPRAFSPGSYYEPGLKVQNEPRLKGSGSCGQKSGGVQGIRPGS
jgi:hypothetical protein